MYITDYAGEERKSGGRRQIIYLLLSRDYHYLISHFQFIVLHIF